MFRILGIDSSLTGTGLAQAWFSEIDGVQSLVCMKLDTVSASKSKPGDTWLAKSRRVHEVLDQIAAVLDENPFDAVILEELAYGAQGDAAVVLHWLWGEIVELVRQRGTTLLLVNVSGIKKFATGLGNAPKDRVMLAMASRYPQYGITDNNQSDALAAVMMGARTLGFAFDTMPSKNLEALTKVVRQ